MSASVRSRPRLKARGAGQQRDDNGGEWGQLGGGNVTEPGNDPGVDCEGERRPLERQLRQVRQQATLPAAQLEPDGDGARGNESDHDEVAGMATEAAVRKAEQDEQERGGENPRVVGKDRERVAEAARQRRVRPCRAGQRRIRDGKPDTERRQTDHRARTERRTPRRSVGDQLCGDHALAWATLPARGEH